jgi:hypothetical protein
MAFSWVGRKGRATGDAARDGYTALAGWVNAALAMPEAKTLDQTLREVFAGKTTAYDKAMDWGYIDPESLLRHVGGQYHRIFDQGHSILGWAKAVWTAPTDHGLLERVIGGGKAYWKDLVTPMGMPVVTWDPAVYKAFSEALQTHLHVSSTWVYDMVTFTATEAAGGVAALAAILLHIRNKDPDRYFELCGSLGISAAAAANPITAAIWLALMMVAFYKAKRFGFRWGQLGAFARGMLVPAIVLIIPSFFAGWPGLVLGFVLAIGIRLLLRRLAVREAVAAYVQEASRTLALPGQPQLLALPAR